MTDDIVTRLRYVVYDDVNAMLIEAADDIDRLRAEIDLKGSRLDDALDEIERLRTENARLSLDLMTALGELMEARRG